jgi:DNA-binding transcriptional MocR family regulator
MGDAGALSAPTPAVQLRGSEFEAHTRVSTIAAQLRHKVLGGEFSHGDHMPSVRQLARLNGVSAFTASRVYDLLVAEGLVNARRGAGYFVAESASTVTKRAPIGQEALADSIWSLRRNYDSKLVRVDAGCGWLPAGWMFAEGVSTALKKVARRPAAYAGRYGSPYGLRALRMHLTTWLAQRNIVCGEDQIVLTQGASQALQLCVGILTQAGDHVLVDDPCYPYVLAMLRARGVHPVGVPRTASGPDVNALQAIAAKLHPRVFITNTTFHNPTGTTTTPQVAHEVLMAARTHNITIVEDDIFSELAADRATSLASLDRLQHVVYIGSFSKTIAPNLRVGFVAAGGDIAERLASLKNILALSSSELTEQIVLAILTGGRHRTHLEALRKRLSQNYEQVRRRFTAAGATIEFRGGGIFLWARLPTHLPTPQIIQMANARGILLAPGQIFRPGSQACDHFRFNVAYANDELLYDFVEHLPS